jgi:hypothetical protein
MLEMYDQLASSCDLLIGMCEELTTTKRVRKAFEPSKKTRKELEELDC